MSGGAAAPLKPFFVQSSGRMRRSAISGVVLLAAAWANTAAPDSAAPRPTGSVPDQSRDHFEGTADHVRIAAVDRLSGGEDKAIVVVVIDRGYHVNANPASEEYLIPTSLNVTNQTPLRILYPEPARFKPEFADQVLDVYEGTIRIVAEFRPGSLTREGRLLGTLTAQACTEKICLPPADLALPDR